MLNEAADKALVKIERELARREKETLKLYRPTPQQIAVHQSGAHELVVRGGKRAGKSLCVAVEFVSRITGTPLLTPTGDIIAPKFKPSTASDPGLYWIIGWAVNHIGQTIHRLLFEPGLFRIIKDPKTGHWRVFNEADPYDAAYFEKSQQAPPLIPDRLIDAKGWSWENKGANIFESCKLVDGTLIRAYPSSSRHAKQGDAVNGIWIDEDVQNADHVKEWQDRLTTKKGWLIWSVWPHRKNYALVEMLDRAEEQKELPKPRVQAVQLTMTANPFIEQESKEMALARMGSEQEIARRDRGELLWEELMMYEYLPLAHTVGRPSEINPEPKTRREVVQYHLARHGRMPNDWTRYIAIDPSHTRTAVVFAAVSPPEDMGVAMGSTLVIEREIVASRMTAEALAEEIAKVSQGLAFEAFIMDQRAGRQTWAGREDSTAEHYSNAFKKCRLASRLTHHGFIPGCDVPSKRYRSVRNLLQIAGNGEPGIFFYDQHTLATRKEFDTYRKKQQEIAGEEVILDEPANPRKHDCMAALEYLAEFVEQQINQGCAYMPPESYQSQGSPAYLAAQKLRRASEKQTGAYVHLGPGQAA